MKKHSKQSLQKEVIGYDNLTTFRKDKLNIYKQICKHNLKDELLGHLTKVSWKKISDADLVVRGKQFKSVAEMIEKDNSVYVMLRTRGLLDKVIPVRMGHINFDEFLSRFPNKQKYKLNIDNYNTYTSKMKITCSKHGEVIVIPKNLVNGSSCPKCAKESMCKIVSNKFSKDLINRCNKIHKDKYDYSKTDISKSHQTVTIICKIHGEFEQSMKDHLCGCGCQVCNNKSDADTFYIWEAVGLKMNNKPIFKFGITSDRLGMARIKKVAKKHNVKYKLHLKIFNENAESMEKDILSKFNDIPEMVGDGATEFRAVEYETIERIKSLYS